MNQPPRIYLDNAATSWPKPPTVYDAVDRYQRELGTPAGRGAYRQAAEVERMVSDARRRVAELLGAKEPKRIIFTANGTDSLNLALHGLLQPGDHVVTTEVEHNSVLRPLRYLQEHRQVEVTCVACDATGVVDPAAIRQAIRPETKLIALVHASNVTGAIQPVEAVGEIAREKNVMYLVDAAQSVGHLSVDVSQIGAHLLAAPAHKGLLGPLGLGILYIAEGVEDRLEPIRQGGTGSDSQQDRQPTTLPDKYESGNLNVPAIVGLGAGVEFLTQPGLDEIRQHDQQLTARLLAGFAETAGVTIYGPRDADKQVGVVSINIEGYDPREVATMLDSAHSIQVRAGFHCAPLMHRAMETDAVGGTVRFSMGPMTNEADVDVAITAVAEIAESAMEI